MTVEQMIDALEKSSIPGSQEIIEALRAGQAMRESIRIVRIVGKSVTKIAEQPLITAASDWSDVTAKRDRSGNIVESKQSYEAWIAKVQDIAHVNEIKLPYGDDLRSYYDDGVSPVWYFEEDERVASQFGKNIR